ncbi:MAG: cytochrome c [Acidimicrobiia bacterium]|nr:cytochrome c [Acidimicrobiia bacterium]
MTQVPEYLLERSRERRAALGLPPSGGGEAPAPAAPGEGGAASAPAAAPAEGGVPATAPASAPATAAEAPVPAVEEPPAPPFVPPAARSGIPVWVVPVLAILPVWAFAYLGALNPPSAAAPVLTPIQAGAQVFAKNCSPCHGAQGEGGVGPKLAGGEAKLTFPNVADHIAWVDTGSISKAKGTPYGDPARPGGQHTVKVAGMPAFKGSLSDTEIQNVVTFERDGLK